MPKAIWGSGDEALTASDIDGAERQETRKMYSGDLPKSGTYRFVIQNLQNGESKNGNPKLRVFATLDGTWMRNHAKYDGCPIWDHIPVMKSTAGRVANFLDAIGASSKDLYSSLVDENGLITKLGKIGDPAGIMVYVNVKQKPADGGYEAGIQVGFNGYIPVSEDDEAEANAGTEDDGDDAPPF